MSTVPSPPVTDMVTPLNETESGSWKLVSVHRPTRHGSPIARGLGLGVGAIPVPVPPPHATTVATHAIHKVRAIGAQPRGTRVRRAHRFSTARRGTGPRRAVP